MEGAAGTLTCDFHKRKTGFSKRKVSLGCPLAVLQSHLDYLNPKVSSSLLRYPSFCYFNISASLDTSDNSSYPPPARHRSSLRSAWRPLCEMSRRNGIQPSLKYSVFHREGGVTSEF